MSQFGPKCMILNRRSGFLLNWLVFLEMSVTDGVAYDEMVTESFPTNGRLLFACD